MDRQSLRAFVRWCEHRTKYSAWAALGRAAAGVHLASPLPQNYDVHDARTCGCKHCRTLRIHRRAVMGAGMHRRKAQARSAQIQQRIGACT